MRISINKNNKTLKIAKLILGFVCVYLFATQIIPIINSAPYMDEFQAETQKWDINTASFFYTDDISSNEKIKMYTDK